MSLSCTENDLEKFLTVSNIPYARSCINFLVNQHLKFRLIIDDYKKTTNHLKTEQAKIISTADNELRKKMVLIEKLQTQVDEERQKRRFQQIKSATDTIDEDDGSEENEARQSFQPEDDVSDDMMHIDNGDTDNDADDDLEYHSQHNSNDPVIPLENEYKSKQDELNRSKKLLNMFCSPRPHQRSANDLSLRNKQNVNVLNAVKKNTMTTPVINRKMNERISVQLTPFHTPNVPSTVRSARLFTSNNQSNCAMGNNITSAPAAPFNKSFTNNHNKSNIMEISSESPLMQQSKSEQNLHISVNSQHTLPVVNNNNKPQQRKNVFSRLTNPKHFTATSRTRAQELQALKSKIRKQKDTHTAIQHKRVDWFAQRSEHETHNEQQHLDDAMEDENHKANPSVFRRLHKTRIRNTRPNLNNSINSNGDECMDQNDSGILLEPSRVVHNQEIAKKAQRNNNNIGSKSMLIAAPVRLLTPDNGDDEL